VDESSLERAYKQALLTEMPGRPRCLDGARNPRDEVTWTTWFDLPASYLDELTPGEYTRSAVEANTPKNWVTRKSSSSPAARLGSGA
jgi:hypothetical protein